MIKNIKQLNQKLTNWVKYKPNQPIPKEYLYEGWQESYTYKNGNTLPLLWIKYRPNEPIPDELKYPNYVYKHNDEGNTPVMYWIKYRPNEPIPEELKFQGQRFDEDGNLLTISQALDLWITSGNIRGNKTYFYYEWCVYKNKRGENVLDWWKKYRPNEVIPLDLTPIVPIM